MSGFDGLLLSITVRDLHRLHSFNGSAREYESLLRDALRNISRLLSFDLKIVKYLNVHRKDDAREETVLFLYYVGTDGAPSSASAPAAAALSHPQVHVSSILSYLSSYKSTQSINAQLIELLAASSSTENSVVLSIFSALLGHFVQLHRQSERRLVDFINECFNREISFFSTLKSKLDSDLNINDEDTMKIVQSLDRVIDSSNTRVYESGSAIHSVSKYSSQEGSFKPPGFSCDDPVFRRLYHLFLQLCAFKNQKNPGITTQLLGETLVDFSEYIRIMIGIYKTQIGAEYLEVNDYSVKDLKFNYFYQKFLDNDLLFPIKYKHITSTVASTIGMFPEENHARNDLKKEEVVNGVHEKAFMGIEEKASPPISGMREDTKSDEKHNNNHDISHTTVPEDLSASDVAELINNLKVFIPQLRKFFQFDPYFPSIMKHYIDLLQSESSDVYVDIEDFEYIGKVLNYINLLVDYENDDNEDLIEDNGRIQVVISEFFHLHLSLSRSDDRDSLTLLMRWTVYDFYRSLELSKKYITHWNYRVMQISQIEYTLEHHWNFMVDLKIKDRYLSKWYTQYKKYYDISRSTDAHYNHLLKANVFQNWYKSVTEYEEKARNFAIKKQFKRWKRKNCSIHSNRALSIERYDEKLTVKAWQLITVSYENKVKLKSIADEYRKAKILQDEEDLKCSLWSIWYEKVNLRFLNEKLAQSTADFSILKSTESEDNVEPLRLRIDKLNPTTLGEKLRKLLQMEKLILLKKFFKAWQYRHDLEIKYKNIRKLNNDNLLKFFFDVQWRKKFELNRAANDKISQLNHTTLKNTFENWRALTDLNLKATEYKNNKLKNKCLKTWKLNLAEQKFHSKEQTNLSLHFKQWQVLLNIRYLEKEKRKALLIKYLQSWSLKISIIEKNTLLAQSFDKSRVATNTFIHWMEEFIKEQEFVQTADLNVQRKHLNILILKYQNIKRLQRAESRTISNSSFSFSERISLKFAFSLWQNVYEKRFENQKQEEVVRFIENVSNPLLLSKALETWTIRYNSKQENYDFMEKQCDTFLRTSTLKNQYFQNWKDKSKQIRHLQEQSDDILRKFLLKKHLAKLYDEFIYILEYLSDQADSYMSQKDIQRAKQLLIKWSMRYKKSIKRQNDYCDDFIVRWKTVKLRAMYDVWVFKMRARMKEEDEDEGDAGNVSMTSPLSSRAHRLNASYLNTPLKKRGNPRILLTPMAPTRVSPTKLQETTEKLKTDRMEKLIKHYQKVKSPDRRLSERSPEKRLLKNSPQKGSNSGSTADGTKINYPIMLPPKPPNFSRSTSKLSQNVDFSPSPTYDEELASIETAKQMRRITPIYVPTQDEMEPRLSLVNKLRERVNRISRLTSPLKGVESAVTSTPVK